MMYDQIITGGKVFDGSVFLSDACVGINDGTIAYVGIHKKGMQGQREWDAGRRVVAPAFIDSHNHGDYHCVDVHNDGCSSLSQGVGTLVVGNCGMSATPKVLPNPILLPQDNAVSLDGPDHCRRLSKNLPLDIADLIGHGTLRIYVMGQARQARDTEIDKMAEILDEFLFHGGLGMSVGLNYPEAAGYTKKELLRLCKVLAKYNRPLTCHIRDQGAGILDAMKEVAYLGQETNCKVLISHLRPISNRFDYLLPELLDCIEQQDNLFMDVYPYVAGFTSLSWLLQHLFARQPDKRNPIPAGELEAKAFEVCIHGLDDVYVIQHINRNIQGHFIGSLARAKNESPGLVAQQILWEDPNCLCIYHYESSPHTVDAIIAHPKCLLGSDGYLFSSGFSGVCHPRSYSAFTGFLVRYVGEKIISQEDGLAKITSKTADFFNLKDRGYLEVGRKANIVIFDFNDLEERGTFEHPARPAKGIAELLIDGKTVFKNSSTNNRAGRRACPS